MGWGGPAPLGTELEASLAAAQQQARLIERAGAATSKVPHFPPKHVGGPRARPTARNETKKQNNPHGRMGLGNRVSSVRVRG